MMVKKLQYLPCLREYHNLQEEWDYIEDPTFSRSIGSHVCMTCSKFDYSIQPSCVSILCCIRHQKLIDQGQHLTHSCNLYQKKTNFAINKKLNYISKAQ